MKKLLFIYPSLYIGGSTTSLLSILRGLDYSQFSVDLLLWDHNGELMGLLPPEVRVLDVPSPLGGKESIRRRKMLSVRSWASFAEALVQEKKTGSFLVRQQITQHDLVRFCRTLDAEYDAAVSFLELWPLYYLAEKVRAKKKIAWYHIDFLAAGMSPCYDREALAGIDHVVLVSEQCKHSFDRALPEYAARSLVLENILSRDLVLARAQKAPSIALPRIEGAHRRLVTVSRLDLSSKGLHRGVQAFARLKREGLLPADCRWYLIGDGPDRGKLEAMIAENALSDWIFLCGAQQNPMPLEAQCDVFFLPSYREGKPMAVTEAQMLGLVPLVTNYSSAAEQIQDGVDGIIVPNDDESIYLALKRYLSDGYDLQRMQETLRSRGLSNESEIRKVERLFD